MIIKTVEQRGINPNMVKSPQIGINPNKFNNGVNPNVNKSNDGNKNPPPSQPKKK